MHRSARAFARIAVVVTVAAAPAPFATPAQAATVARCTRLTAAAPAVIGGVHTRTALLSGCTPLSATGGAARSVTNLATLVSTTTWAGGKGTTVAKVAYAAGPRGSNCPAATHATIETEKVTGGSGAAAAVVKIGDTVTARWCVTAKFAVLLEPGTAVTFDGPSAPPTNGNPPPPVPLPKGLSECPSNAAAAVTALVNRDRHDTAELPPLKESANLDWAARKHSIAMAVKSTSFHDGWDTEIRDSNFRAGPPGWIGQNVGWMIAPFEPKLIESGFFDEKPPEDGHRLNILNVNYHDVGIGCINRKSTGAIFSTQDFGS